jgi:hypothetical protein
MMKTNTIKRNCLILSAQFQLLAPCSLVSAVALSDCCYRRCATQERAQKNCNLHTSARKKRDSGQGHCRYFPTRDATLHIV